MDCSGSHVLGTACGECGPCASTRLPQPWGDDPIQTEADRSLAKAITPDVMRQRSAMVVENIIAAALAAHREGAKPC